MKKSLLTFGILLAVLAGNIHAQNGSAIARLDSNHILIGDQVVLHLIFKGSTTPLFPLLQDSIQALEIVRTTAIDTHRENNMLTLQQSITLTSFDSGTYEIPAFFFFGKDSQILAGTQPLILEVSTIAVDTTANIKAIKSPLAVPLTWKEIGKYMLLAACCILLVIGIVLLVHHLKSKGGAKTEKKSVPKEAAHLIAFKALKTLQDKKLWQKGEYKTYYSELTDILRTYLFNRWEIPAMEMVSDEIMEAVSRLPLQNFDLSQLQQLLQTADSVKFAKAVPLPDENSLAGQVAYLFVDATKITESEKNDIGGTTNV